MERNRYLTSFSSLWYQQPLFIVFCFTVWSLIDFVFVGFLFHVAIVLILIAIIVSTSLLIRRLFSLTFNGSICCTTSLAFVFLELYRLPAYFLLGCALINFIVPDLDHLLRLP
ncbi:hypothetical protein H9L39_07706 [Fusarium oxysporum f. sp. albedinis]|nr:hypothetical protein H9L39_07706 [Fusarium oxysporum f. sp. albedinis]